MLNLVNYSNQVEEFIQNSIEIFQAQNGIPNSIGIYCCPWAGWLSINFNLDKTLSETDNNCPDFQFVEFDLLELTEWQEEYESDTPLFVIKDVTIKHNSDNWDENLNELIFSYLRPIVKRVNEKYDSIFLLQMLDSRFVEAL